MKFIVNGVEVDANGKPLAESEQANAATGELDALRQRVAALEGERDTLAAELADLKAQGVIPDDAHARLVRVNGIGEKLADQALDALKAKAEPPQDE